MKRTHLLTAATLALALAACGASPQVAQTPAPAGLAQTSGAPAGSAARLARLEARFGAASAPAHAQSLPPGLVWPFGAFTRQFGTPSTDFADAVALDPAGNSYVAGVTRGSFPDFTNAGGADVFVAKFDVGGKQVWLKQFGSSGLDFPTRLALDLAGNVYVAGATQGSLNGQAFQGDTDGFLVKLDRGGALQWTRQVGSAGFDCACGLAVDLRGDVYLSGDTAGGLDGHTSAGGQDFYVQKYDASGAKLWTRQLGTAGDDTEAALTVDQRGNVILGGLTTGSFPGNTNLGDVDDVVIKLDPAGRLRWTTQYGTAGEDRLEDLTTDLRGNVYTTGETAGSLDGQPSAGGQDAYVLKLTPDGRRQWTRQFGSDQDDLSYAIQADLRGNVAVAGFAGGRLPGQTSAGKSDAFVASFGNQGERRALTQFGTPEDDGAYDLAFDLFGNVVVVGGTEGSLSPDGSAGRVDAFVTRLKLDGHR